MGVWVEGMLGPISGMSHEKQRTPQKATAENLYRIPERAFIVSGRICNGVVLFSEGVEL